MPEGPEVRALCRKLNSSLSGLRIERFVLSGGPIATNPKPRYAALRASLEGWIPAKITSIVSHGKNLFWYTDSDQVISAHLGMEGSFDPIATKSVVVEVVLESTSVFFNDSRRFGSIGVISVAEAKRLRARLGPDVLDFDSLGEVYRRLFAAEQPKPVSTELLRQEFLAGIGNYLRCDILYTAKLSPLRLFSSLTSAERIKLAFAVVDVVNRAWTEYPSYVRSVYRKKLSPTGQPVVSLEQAGRTVYWSPSEQV